MSCEKQKIGVIAQPEKSGQSRGDKQFTWVSRLDI
jgi:hypothetical protein